MSTTRSASPSPRQSGSAIYRASAHDDPHGTRAIAMALSSNIRGQLADPASSRPWTGSIAIAAVQLGMMLALNGAPSGVPLMFLGLIVLGHRGHILYSRFQVNEHELVVVGPKSRETFPWPKVESFETHLLAARVTVRIGDALETRRALRNVLDRVREPDASLIPTAVRELAGRARRSVATVFGSIGVVIFSIALGMALAMHADSGEWAVIGVGALCYLLVSLGITFRNHLTAKADGLHLPHRVIPWLAIEDAAPKEGPGSTEVRIRVIGEDELTVFCGDAEGAAVAILERRNVARRIRAERGPLG